MTMVWAWFYIAPISNMRRLLSSSQDNGLSMVLNGRIKKHAAAAILSSWQWSEHAFIQPRYQTWCGCCRNRMAIVCAWFIRPYKETCGACCPHLMTVVRAWFYIAPISNMRWVLSSLHGNGLSLVLYCLRKKHEVTGVLTSWQWSEHDFT